MACNSPIRYLHMDLGIVEASCRYGSLFIFDGEDVVSRSLSLYGEWAEHEIAELSNFVRPNTLVIDVGANLGSHSIAIARRFDDVLVWGFEPQPVVASLASVNCLRNAVQNAIILRAACGRRSGKVAIYPPSYGTENVGGFQIREDKRPSEGHTIQRGLPFRPAASPPGETVPIVRLDSLVTPYPVSLIKIDVEGTEQAVVEGAYGLIKRDRPAVFFEVLTVDGLKPLIRKFRSVKYRMFWLETHQYNRDNFNRMAENIWYRTEMGIIALPVEVTPPMLPEVLELPDYVPFRYDARAGISISKLPLRV